MAHFIRDFGKICNYHVLCSRAKFLIDQRHLVSKFIPIGHVSKKTDFWNRKIIIIILASRLEVKQVKRFIDKQINR